MLPRIATVLSLVALAGCEGSIGPPAGTDPVLGATGGGAGSAAVVLPTVQVPRLSATQYQNTVLDVLEPKAAAAAAGVVQDAIGEKDHRYRTLRAAEDAFIDLSYERLDAASWAIAQALFDDLPSRDAAVGCAPVAAGDGCSLAYVSRVGRLLYRRSLTPDELEAYRQLLVAVTVNEGGDLGRGLEAATAALLQSPSFVYRVDLGVPDAPGTVRFTGLELASRLALLLWDSGPDAALLDAAERGELDTPDGLGAHVQLMLLDPRAARGIGAFATDWLDTDRLIGMAKDPIDFPEWSPQLADELRQEIRLLAADQVLTRDADFLELLTTRRTYLNHDVSAITAGGTVTGTDFVAYTYPDTWDRATVLTTSGFLAAHSGARDRLASAPIKRGLFLNERLLCKVFGAPPANAQDVASQVAAGLDSATMTTRQITAAVTSPSQCQACHAQINPLGFSLENFGAIGTHRPTEVGQTIDSSGVLDGAAFQKPAELGALLRQTPAVRSCLVAQVYGYALGRQPVDREGPTLTALDTQFSGSGQRLSALLVALAKSDAFRTARVSP